jgi:tetratricopeptide (TPR) repeat protein
VPPSHLQPKCPRDLETICLKCLQKDPARRYASARVLADDCAAFLQGESIQARPVPAWARVWQWVRRRPARVAAGAGLVLLLLLLLLARKAHLEGQVSRALLGERVANRKAAVAGAEEGLAKALAAVDARDWQKASAGVDSLLSQLEGARAQFPEAPELGRLLARAGRLRDQIARRLTDLDRYYKLGNYRDDACFDRMMGFGLRDGPGRRDKARALVGEALGLFHAAVESGAGLPLENADFTEAQKREIREGCCELLLDLARLEAEPDPGQGPAQRRRQAESARRVLDRAAELGVPSAVYHRRRADCLALLGEERAARSERERARGCPLTTAFDFFLRGNDLYNEGRLADAVRHFDSALALQPSHYGAHYALAVCYLKLHSPRPDLRRAHLALARANLTFCIYQQPRRIWPYLLRGFAHGELGEFEAARADFARVEEALRHEPNEAAHYGVLVNRGVIRILQKDLAGAVDDLTRAVRLKPEDYPAYVNLAQAYQELKQHQKAGEQLDKAVALKPSPATAAVYRTRARWHQRQGDLEAALSDLGQAIRHEPRGPASPEAAGDRLERGRLLLQGGRCAAAVRELDAALAIQPDSPEAHRLRAEALLRLERFARALPSLDRYLAGEVKKGPTLAAAYRARGRARSKVGDHAGAAEDYTHALALEPADAGTHAGRGWAYVLLEAPALALRDFDKALELEPQSADACNGRGYARVKLGRYREGARDAEQAVRLGPPDTRTCYNAARALAQAALRAEADSLPKPGARELSTAYRERAVSLLRQAHDALPADQRPSFWRQTVLRDAALSPLRHTTGFRQLTQAHADVSRDRP